ncbi:MAG: CHAT domain-containing protein, partial [Kofleriaceae bacterium]
ADDDRDRTSRQLAGALARGSGGDAAAGVCAARAAAVLAPAGAPRALRDAVFIHPIDDGWLVLAWRAHAIELRTVARGADPADRIAEAAAAMLAGAPRVQLHVHRSLVALPIDRKLAARLGVPVAFGVDAPEPAPGAACHGPRRALVVANPQANLRGASEAVPVVRGHLARLGLVVDVLEGGEATRAAVTARLAEPCTELFEYDGHAAARSGDRVDDALLLAGGETLTAADVLGLPRAPAAIVLDGCTTAAPEGLGLAQAFLLAGAHQVIASLDEVPDAAAARFTRALFAGDGAVDLAARFARVSTENDLAMLRVFER